jgi:Tfp pilus assembly protein PilO
MRKSDMMRTLSWLVPALCCLLAIVVVGWQFQKLRALRAETEAQTRSVANLKQALELFETRNVREQIPYVADSRMEEAQFLDTVRKHAIANEVRLVRWVNEPPPPIRPDENTPEKEKVPEFARKVRTLISTAEVTGKYENVRKFVADLLGSTRLLTVRSAIWSRETQTSPNVLSFKLHRYVSATPLPGETAAAGNSISAGGNQG